jgi:hypothetical protein
MIPRFVLHELVAPAQAVYLQLQLGGVGHPKLELFRIRRIREWHFR